MAEIDSLEVKIEATSKGANDQLDRLIAKMGDLSKQLDGINAGKLESLATVLKSTANLLGNMKGSSMSIKNVSKDLNNMSNISKNTEQAVADLSSEIKNVASGSSNTNLKKQQNDFKATEQQAKNFKDTWKDVTTTINSYKAPLSDIINEEVFYGAKETISTYGISTKDVITDLNNFVTDFKGNMLDLANINISDELGNWKINSNLPRETNDLIIKHTALKGLLIKLENNYNRLAQSTENFTNTSNKESFINASKNLQGIVNIGKVLNELDIEIDESYQKANDLIGVFKQNISGMNIKTLNELLIEFETRTQKIKDIIESTPSYSFDTDKDSKKNLTDYYKMKEFIPVLKERIAELGGTSEVSSKKMSDSFKDIASNVFSKLKNSASNVFNSMNKEFNKSTLVVDGFKGVFNKFGTSVNNLKNKFAGTTFGGTLISAFKIINASVDGTINIISKLKDKVGEIVGVFGKFGRVASKPLALLLKFGGVGTLTKSFSLLNESLKNTQKHLLRVSKMFSLMIIRKGLQAVIENITGSFNDLTKQSASVNASISSIIASFKWLGASITGAFSPILNVVSPILDALVKKCVSVINTIGQVFASLTGAKTYTFAKKVQTDYAGSLEDTKKATDDATKSAKEYENQLLGFDEITKLSAPTDNNSNGSGGSGSGASVPVYEYVFDSAEIEKQYTNWADKIKEAWNNGDFTEIGVIVGDKLSEALASIKWDKIQNTSNKIAKSIATFLNGAMTTDLFSQIGVTLAECINTAFGTVFTFIDTFRFDTFGTQVAKLLNNAFATTDWGTISKTIISSMNGIFATVFSFSDEFEWEINAEKLVNTVKDSLTGIEWGKGIDASGELGRGLASAINKVFALSDADKKSLGVVLGESMGEALNVAIEFFSESVGNIKFENIGKNIADCINNLLASTKITKGAQAFSDLAIGILDALITAIDELDEEQLNSVIKALVEDIDWENITLKAIELLLKWWLLNFKLKVKAFGYGINDVMNEIVTAIEEYDGVLSTEWFLEIGGNVSDGFNKAKDEWNNLKEDTKELLAIVKGKIEDGFNKAKDGWNGLKEGTKELLAKAKGDIADKFTSIKNSWGSLKDKATKTITASAKGVKNTAFDSIVNVINKAKSSISLSVKLAKSGWTSIKSWILGKVSSFKLPISLPKIKVNWGEKTVAGFKIKFPSGFSTYAQGGFPTTGEMFIARESGPEMVGKIGNRTTVANNQQIVEGISSGVYNAVVSAMAQYGGNRSNNVNVVLEGDAKGLFRVVQSEGKTYQMSTGLPVF